MTNVISLTMLQIVQFDTPAQRHARFTQENLQGLQKLKLQKLKFNYLTFI